MASRRLLGIAAAGVLAVVPLLDAAPAGTSYTVRKGDSLWAISQRHGVAVDALARANGLKLSSVIRPGQVLVVPVASAPPAAPGPAPARPATTAVATTRPAPLPTGLPPRLPAEVRGPAQLALLPLFDDAAAQAGVPADLLMAVAFQESRWRQDRVSPHGAVGVGQLLPATAAWVATTLLGNPSLDPTRTGDNIRMSARYLRYLIDLMRGDVARALAAYYQGPNGVLLVGVSAGAKRYAAQVLAWRPLFVR